MAKGFFRCQWEHPASHHSKRSTRLEAVSLVKTKMGQS